MKHHVNLLEGPIFPALSKLALPIMGTSLIQMAYNMTDMIWIGRVGSGAVAAVGAAGMYMWLSSGIATLSRMGGQIKVAHSLGAKDTDTAAAYAQSALWMGLLSGILYGLLAILFHGPLIDFFRLNSPQVVADAQIYLLITCGLIVFSILNQILTGIFTAMGNSKTPFLATAVGLVINIVLDPVLIFGLGPIPALGVAGAAIATVLAQMIVTLVFMVSARRDSVLFQKVHLWSRPPKGSLGTITRIGLPMCIQSMMFTGISMIIARMISGWGDTAVAVQKVGSQIESISWMAADGFSSAVNSFVGQNYGARNMRRVKRGYKTAVAVALVWGLITTLILVFLPQYIFGIFMPEASVIPLGVDYLRIIGYSQLFMCMEIMTSGAFSGLGKTVPPAVESIVLTAGRIPLAMALSATALGLNGIWWSISISSILKGIILVTWFLLFLRRLGRSRTA